MCHSKNLDAVRGTRNDIEAAAKDIIPKDVLAKAFSLLEEGNLCIAPILPMEDKYNLVSSSPYFSEAYCGRYWHLMYLGNTEKSSHDGSLVKGNGWHASICIQKRNTGGWGVGMDLLQ